MDLTGRCYCGAIRYRTVGDAAMRAQCHCRECQYVSGGHPNVIVAMPESGFAWVKGTPKQFRRGDLPTPVTRYVREVQGLPIFTWTVRTQEDRKIASQWADAPIFEGRAS